VLSDGSRPDIVRKEQERRLIEQHVGRFIITWGHLDLTLSMTVAARANPAGAGVLQRNFFEMQTFTKIGFLQSLIHPEWSDGGRLVNLLTEGNKYRNHLAHPLLAMGGYHGDREHGWHLWKPNKDGGTLNLDDAEMLTKERDARIATAGVAALMRDEFIHARTLHDWQALALGETILQSPGTWATEKEYDAFCHRVESLFGI
jgi:hypothetical protein